MGDGELTQEQLTGKILTSFVCRIELENWFSSEFAFPLDNSRRDKIEQLKLAVEKCELCPLHKTKTKSVFGEGNINAELMFVGEAPGRDEDLSGRPFVGVAGQLLTNIIQAMGKKREDVFITNVLRCRPPENRNPEPEEIVCCRPFLQELIKLIQPKVICTLGKFSASVLLNSMEPISRIRGKFFELEGIKIMPTFHPAYLLRNPQDKKLVWHDMQAIMKYLQNPKDTME